MVSFYDIRNWLPKKVQPIICNLILSLKSERTNKSMEVFNIRPATKDKPKMPKLKNNVASSMMEMTRNWITIKNPDHFFGDFDLMRRVDIHG